MGRRRKARKQTPPIDRVRKMFTMNEHATAQRIGPELSVDEVIELWPRTIGVMNDLGLDTCCGGYMSLRRAARNARVALPLLLQKLEQTVEELESDPYPVRSF